MSKVYKQINSITGANSAVFGGGGGGAKRKRARRKSGFSNMVWGDKPANDGSSFSFSSNNSSNTSTPLSNSRPVSAYEAFASSQNLDMGSNHPPVWPSQDGGITINTNPNTTSVTGSGSIGAVSGSLTQQHQTHSGSANYPACGSCHSQPSITLGGSNNNSSSSGSGSSSMPSFSYVDNYNNNGTGTSLGR